MADPRADPGAARGASFALDPPVYQRLIYVPADFEHDLEWQELDGDHDVFGDGRVVAVSTPGHTRGHQSLMVRLDSGQTVILLADATYLLEKMRERALPAVLWSPDAMVASWERIEALEREHDAVLSPPTISTSANGSRSPRTGGTNNRRRRAPR